MITAEKITSLVNESLTGTDLFVVEVRVRSGNRISVFIDSDTKVHIKNCAETSRYIESKLDREKEDFELEVSSAGLDQPLKLHRQYKKNIGNDLKIETNDGKTWVAALLGIADKNLTLRVPENKKLKTHEQEVVVAFADIKEAKIVIKINNK
ncbi:MAG: ribosome assembly cofactor RimP [Bacteroidota bacterium]